MKHTALASTTTHCSWAALALLSTACNGSGPPEAAVSDSSCSSSACGDAAPADDAGALPTPQGGGCGASAWPASGTFTLDVNGVERRFIVQLPERYAANVPYKLVLAWHGFTSSAQQVVDSGFVGLAARANGSAIFVAGQGLDTNLLGVTAAGWNNQNGRDVAFARALLGWLRDRYCIDDARIFSIGTSMGGYMSNQLGCELQTELRAVASIMGGGPLALNGARCSESMPAFLVHGTMDTINAFAQGVTSREHWREVNGCSTTSKPTGLARCVTYDGCQPDGPLVWCEHDGGHVVPDFAGQGAWEFFAQF